MFSKGVLLAPVIFVGLAIVFNEIFIPRVNLPSHLLGHPAVFRDDFITQKQSDELMEVIKKMAVLPTNAQDTKFYTTKHEHIGEAVPLGPSGKCSHALMVPNKNRTLCVFPGRMDIGRHYIMTGGHEGLRESYERLVSRVLSFGVYLFNLTQYPPLAALFQDEGFLEGSRSVCPHDRRYLDPFQFNFIINTPGQTVAHHIDAPYFWGATRFQFPQWLLACMKFSGLFEDRYVHQVQVVSYLHQWNASNRAGHFVYFSDNSGKSYSMHPAPRSANIVDGAKVVHCAAVYRPEVSPPVLRPSSENALHYEGDDKWTVRTDGKVLSHLKTDDLRVTIVYRARCFKDESEADKFRKLSTGESDKEEGFENLTLDQVLTTLKQDMVQRGVLTPQQEISAQELGLLMVKTYIKYPLPPSSRIPYNYCALGTLFPSLAPLINKIC